MDVHNIFFVETFDLLFLDEQSIYLKYKSL